MHLGINNRALPDAGLNAQQTSECADWAGVVHWDFNDDSLGHNLDVRQRDDGSVRACCQERWVRMYRVEHRFVHFDSCSFHLHGEYAEEEPNKEAIGITRRGTRETTTIRT